MVADYLRVRRSLGYKLDHAEYILTRFADYVQASDAPHPVTVAHALAFATAPPGASPRWQRCGCQPSAASPGGHTRSTPPSRCRRRGCCRPDPPEPRLHLHQRRDRGPTGRGSAVAPGDPVSHPSHPDRADGHHRDPHRGSGRLDIGSLDPQASTLTVTGNTARPANSHCTRAPQLR